jgi:hypothetical protein
LTVGSITIRVTNWPENFKCFRLNCVIVLKLNVKSMVLAVLAPENIEIFDVDVL